jgi:uncharacterized protein (DUF4415 family)
MKQDEPPAPDRSGGAGETAAEEPAAMENAADTRIEVELDNYVMEWFREQGENYEDLMNQVLRDYIAAEEAATSQANAAPEAQ